jgi:hypothetical protein
LTIVLTANPDSSYTANGTLTSDGSAVANGQITVSAAGWSTTATTTARGRYAATLQLSQPGEQTVTASTSAGGTCANEAWVQATVTVAPLIDLLLDAATITVKAGETVTVAGRLLGQGNPVVEALIYTNASWNGQELSWITNAEGTFSALLTAPDNTSGSFSVRVSFSGDGFYPSVSHSLAVEIEEAPSPTPSPSASAGPAASSAAPAASSAAVTSAPAVAPAPWSQDSRLFLVLLVFLVVVALATGALIIIAVVTRQRRGLAADERRGFGSDFGRSGPGDDLEDWEDFDGSSDPAGSDGSVSAGATDGQCDIVT